MLTSAGSDGIALFDAVDKQLGLKLDLQKVPIPVIVVDSVNEKPTDNLPGVSAKLPPLPTEFEVADIKPSLTGTQPKYAGGAAGAASALLRLNICQNVTMAQFADWLQGARNQARTYMNHPIVDATGIDGNRDFTLTFSGFLAFQTNGGGRGGDAQAASVATATDPNGAITLGEALEKQLGLKLELRKRPMPVLVIDHIEQKPTDN